MYTTVILYSLKHIFYEKPMQLSFDFLKVYETKFANK